VEGAERKEGGGRECHRLSGRRQVQASGLSGGYQTWIMDQFKENTKTKNLGLHEK
jgi:hypothetical protein